MYSVGSVHSLCQQETVQNAERIIVLHHGKLHETGTHAELLEADGLYARLHELQFAAAVPS